MRLTRLFLLTTGLLLSLVTAMLVRAVWSDWRTVAAAQNGLEAMQRAYLGMKVAEKASAERGPTILVLNDTEPPEPSKRARLEEFRGATDTAFAEAMAALGVEPETAPARAQLEQARTELLRARVEVNRVAALPYAQRSAPGQRLARAPIEHMFAVIDTVLGSVTTLSAAAEAAYPALSMPLVSARYAAELREYAGRLGSQFTTALATQQALDPIEQREIQLLTGRIEQLRKLISLQARVGRADGTLQSAIERMEASYFEADLAFATSIAARGVPGAAAEFPLRYGLDSAAFVARYVPPMKTIVDLRDAMFNAARNAATASVEQTQRRLAINTGLGLAVLLVELMVFLLIRNRVLLPLLRSTRAMRAIMAGRATPADHEPLAARTDEIGDMQRAVAALRDATLRGRALEAEREQLIEQLRVASDTDFLTGLPNRRAFESRAAGMLAQARRHGWSVALLLFDIDHFKRINDEHGHPAGDQVLRATAVIAQGEIRQGELLARHGGEEFAMLATDCRLDEALRLAERLRATLAGTDIPTAEGPVLGVTASFGLACADARDVHDLDTLFRDADRALYAAKGQGRNQVQHADALPQPASEAVPNAG